MKFRSRRYVAMSKEGHPMEPKHILKISTDSGFTNVASDDLEHKFLDENYF